MALLARSEFLAALKITEPGLGEANSVPQFSRFWFDGACVSAYNDDVGIAHILKTDFKGGVSGETILKLLIASRAESVEILQEEDKLSMKMGRTRPTLAIDDINHACWSMPKPKGKPLPIDMETLIDGVKHCMRSIGSQPSAPESMGVTFENAKNSLSLYGTTDTALSKAEVPLKGKVSFDRLTIHRKFCELLIGLSKDGHKLQMELSDEHALLTTKNFGVYGRIMGTDKPIDFERQISESLNGGNDKGSPIPERLLLMLKRSMILASNDKVSLAVKPGKRGQLLTIHAQSDIGQLRDSIPFDHPDVSVIVNPNDIQAGCDLSTISISDNGIVMRSKGKTYVVATIPGQ